MIKKTRTLLNTQYLKKIERLNSNSKKSTRNLEELGFLDLPQTNRWKCRSCSKDHVFGIGFEFGGFILPRSRVLYQNPNKEREREREREKAREISWKSSSSNFNTSQSRQASRLSRHSCAQCHSQVKLSGGINHPSGHTHELELTGSSVC
jgi:hypothetical protein